jgi:hypothetical protein
MRSELQEVKNWLVRYGPVRDQFGIAQGALEHTLRRSRNSTAQEVARKLYAMNRRISNY